MTPLTMSKLENTASQISFWEAVFLCLNNYLTDFPPEFTLVNKIIPKLYGQFWKINI